MKRRTEGISRGFAQKRSIREITKGIGRSPSTIAREVKRNRGKMVLEHFLRVFVQKQRTHQGRKEKVR